MIEIIEADLGVPAHAEAVVRLLNVYAQDEMGGGQPLSGFVQANLVAELAKRDSYVVLATVDGEASGMVVCLEGFSTFACKPLLNIHDVIVSPRCRGRGIAKLMLHKAEEIARRLGCCKLTLEVLEGNHAAQAAYRAFGFNSYELDPKMGRAMFWEKKLPPLDAAGNEP